MANPKLSKSKVMNGLQCPKRLYLETHHPELVPETSEAQQAIFDQGHLVGKEAQKHFPGGVLITASARSKAEAVKETSDAIKSGAHTIFEAAFEVESLHVKVDVLKREKKRWNLIEVKSTNSLKAEHLTDIAVQAHVVAGSGLALKAATLMHLNRDCRFPKLEDLFKTQDVTAKIEPDLAQVPEKLKALRAMLTRPKAPEVAIGARCYTPYACPFIEQCHKGKIPTPSIFDFPGVGDVKGWDLFEQGIVKLTDKRFGPFKGTKALQLEVARSGKRWVDASAIAKQIKKWKWPLHYLDFETIGYAIPKFKGTGPYQAVPFQFSCSVQGELSEKGTHSEFLHDSDTDPRADFIEALLASIGPRGDIVAFNKATEVGEIKKLALAFPKYRAKLNALVDRFVDPLPIFRSAVYDPAFRGSFSIKDIAPALLGPEMSYETMAVGDGMAAGRGFNRMIDSQTPAAERRRLRQALLAYCKKDTDAMMGLVAWLFTQTSRTINEK